MLNTKEKEKNEDSAISVSEQEWLCMYPDVQVWAAMNKDTIEWMTEATNNNMNPRSDCG